MICFYILTKNSNFIYIYLLIDFKRLKDLIKIICYFIKNYKKYYQVLFIK